MLNETNENIQANPEYVLNSCLQTISEEPENLKSYSDLLALTNSSPSLPTVFKRRIVTSLYPVLDKVFRKDILVGDKINSALKDILTSCYTEDNQPLSEDGEVDNLKLALILHDKKKLAKLIHRNLNQSYIQINSTLYLSEEQKQIFFKAIFKAHSQLSGRNEGETEDSARLRLNNENLFDIAFKLLDEGIFQYLMKQDLNLFFIQLKTTSRLSNDDKQKHYKGLLQIHFRKKSWLESQSSYNNRQQLDRNNLQECMQSAGSLTLAVTLESEYGQLSIASLDSAHLTATVLNSEEQGLQTEGASSEDNSVGQSMQLETASTAINSEDQNIQLTRYVASFENKTPYSQQAEEKGLNCTDEDLLDPVTFEIINIPVRVDGVVFDFNTLKRLETDANGLMENPLTREAFPWKKVQRAPDIRDRIEAFLADQDQWYSAWVPSCTII